MWNKKGLYGRLVMLCVAAGTVGCGRNPSAVSTTSPQREEKTPVGRIVVVGPERRVIPAGVAIYDPGRHDHPRWEGLAGEEFRLPHARYDILVEYFGQRHWLSNEELAGGDKSITLPMAVLSVAAVSSRGDRLEGKVDVFAAGAAASGPPLVSGETGEDLLVLAGTCDVRVTLQGRERWLRGLSLTEGDRVVQEVIEPVGYIVAEVVDQRGELLDADVWVYDPASPRRPASWGRAGEPIAVVPGRYDVAVRYGGERDYASALTVKANQTTKEVFTFFRGSVADGEQDR